RAEAVMCRHAFYGAFGYGVPLLLMPAAPQDPRTRLGLGRCRTDHSHDVVPGTRLCKIEHHLRLPETHNMSVPFDEAGPGELAFEVDDLRLRANVGVDLLARA